MKQIFFLLVLTMLISSASAQYGRLEPLRDWDTVNVVLRTPKKVVAELIASADKDNKKIGQLIEATEKQLEFARGGFLINRTASINTTMFTRNVQTLQKLGVDPNYYIQEFFVYFPRPSHRTVQ